MTNSKKNTKVVTRILLIVFVCAIMIFSSLYILIQILDINYINEEDFKTLYQEKQADFDYVGKELLKLSEYMAEDDRYYGTIREFSCFSDLMVKDRQYDSLGEGLIVCPNIHSNIEYKLDEIRKIDVKRIKTLFKDDSIKRINIRKNHIRFYNKGPVCIIYSQNLPPFDHLSWAVNYEYVPIADNWYYLHED